MFGTCLIERVLESFTTSLRGQERSGAVAVNEMTISYSRPNCCCDALLRKWLIIMYVVAFLPTGLFGATLRHA